MNLYQFKTLRFVEEEKRRREATENNDKEQQTQIGETTAIAIV